MDTLTLTSANTVYNLYSLMSAIEPALPKPAQALMLQFDIDAGSARLQVGGLQMTASNGSYGALLFAGYSFGIDSLGANLIVLPQITLLCDTAGQKLHVIVVTR